MSQETQHVHRHKQTKAIVNRLSRIEGHVRSIKTMVQEERDCSDVLIQLAAVRSAIDKVGRVVLEDHLESCLFHVGILPEDNEIWAGVKEALDVYL
jgi:DNA-binding FrmR family transcriptional regulator